MYEIDILTSLYLVSNRHKDEIATQLYTLLSPSSLNMGRFARFAQATYLLEQVYRHVSDQTSDPDFHKEEAKQLHRTIHALLRVAEIESQTRKLGVCTQMAVCYWYVKNPCGFIAD